MSWAEAWFRQAERELVAARNSLRSGDYFAAAFWAQQAAEKALKALLMSRGIVARTHNLLELGRLVREELGMDISELVNELRELTIHYTVARYPNAANAVPYELYDEAGARRLVEMADKVVEWVRRRLR